MIKDNQTISLTGKSNQEETEAHQEGSLRKYRGEEGGPTGSGIFLRYGTAMIHNADMAQYNLMSHCPQAKDSVCGRPLHD